MTVRPDASTLAAPKQGDLFAPDPEATMAFVLRLRARGLADVDVLRAVETVPRHLFVPHIYADLAWRDIALPIACGQTMPDPWLVARMMEALRVAPKHRVLEIGTGSGYATAILARLAAEVVSYERFRTLASEAAARLKLLGVDNARVIHDDGLAPAEGAGVFDRVLVHGALERVPESIIGVVSEGAHVVFACMDARGRATLMRLSHENDGQWRESDLGPATACELVSGKSTTI